MAIEVWAICSCAPSSAVGGSRSLRIILGHTVPHPSIRRWKPVRHPLASLPFSASRLHPTTTNTLTNDTSCSRAHWNNPATYLYLPGASRRSLESDVCWLILNKYLLHVIPEKPLYKVEASQPAQTWGAWRRAGRDVLHKGIR